MRVFGSVAVAVAVALLALAAFRIALPACAALPVVGELFPSHCPPVHITETDRLLHAAREKHAMFLAQLDQLQRGMLMAVASCPVRPAPADASTIDPDRWRAQDISLLEGCWQLETDYRIQSASTGEIYTVPEWEMCFDAAGNGQQHFAMSNGMRCTSDVTASFLDNGKLLIREGGDVPCTEGYVYERKITCRLDERNHAVCETYQMQTDAHSNASFHR